MKSLSYALLIALLSLEATKSGAQIDSNSVVNVFCDGVSASCMVYISRSNVHGPLPGDSTNVYLSTSFDGSYLYGQRLDPKNFPYSTRNPYFKIDSVQSQIDSLTLMSACEVPGFHYDGHSGYASMAILMLTFGPIPFQRNGSTIFITPGKYSGGYSLSAWALGTDSSEWPPITEQGDGSILGTVSDSITLEIILSNAGVRSNQDFNHSLNVRINGKSFYFDVPANDRTLQILNALGSSVLYIPILSGEVKKEISLLPGLYLARLGSQITKFIVTE